MKGKVATSLFLLSVFAAGIMGCGEDKDMVVADSGHKADTTDTPGMLTDEVEETEEDSSPRVTATINIYEAKVDYLTTSIGVVFNKPMKSVEITVSGVAGSVHIDTDGKVAWFTPSEKMAVGVHTLNVSGKDKQGRRLANFVPFTFTVTLAPIKIESVSVSEGTVLSANHIILATFSREPPKVKMTVSGAEGVVIVQGVRAVWTPISPMSKGVHTLSIDVYDELGELATFEHVNFTVE